MYSYLFERFTIENQHVDFNNFMLWIIKSDKIPPHIGVSQNFKFYSLKASGKDNGLSTLDTFSFLKKKKIEFIVVEMKTTLLDEELEKVYSAYSKAIPTKISCINPILDCFNLKKPMLLFDLLKHLKAEGVIRSVNVYNFFRENLGIGVYGEKEVSLEIQKLQSVKRK